MCRDRVCAQEEPGRSSLMLSGSQYNLCPKTHALLVWGKAVSKWNSLFQFFRSLECINLQMKKKLCQLWFPFRILREKIAFELEK